MRSWGEFRADSGPLLAPSLARAIVATVFFGLCLVAFLQVVDSTVGHWPTVAAGGVLLVLLALQVGYFSRPGVALSSSLSHLLLIAQAVLVFLPQQEFGQAWAALPSLLAGTVLLVLPSAAAGAVFTVIIAVIAANQESLTHSTLDVAYIVVGSVGAALHVFGLTRLAGLITDLHEARTELGRFAVAEERSRFARDLHDLLGLSLAAIGPKGTVARAVMAADPDRARAELGEILTVARHALADVRLISSGYREVSLREETRSVESLLAASNVDVRMELNHGELPPRLRSVLAAVLRVGVANVLHHTDVARCDITLRQAGQTVTLDIVDDGVSGRCHPEFVAPDGLAVVTDQVAALGGRLVAGPDPDGRFGLHLTIPVARERAPRADEPIPRYATWLATGLMNVVFVGFLCAAMLHLLYQTHDPEVLVFSGICLAGLVSTQLFLVSKPGARPTEPQAYLVVAGQAVLVYLPLAVFPHAWASVPGLLAGTILLVLRAPVAVPALVAVAATVTWTQGGSALPGVVITALVTYGLTWMARTVSDLRTARRELAAAAVARERLRFGRDLHDLLGLSLSAITLKAELAYRAMRADPARSAAEVAEIEEIARLALADVRLVAGGYRDLSLSEESRAAEAVLAAADVDVRMDLRYGELPASVLTVLATVLREGVTNVLRHSRGARCEISVRRVGELVELEIVNDGAIPDSAAPGGGNGIRNLSDRVRAVDGELVARDEGNGVFRLTVRVPAQP
ncbi:sensor histidine kinase [Alloactinosynnema sp. L-07]|uniref:sensor histidine kinase n=1 Tax=Alloactinosynnema sp. L-07 TaxID=1653480 RepID=UPI00065EFB83|nr:histidine kinase [Alloactinosynnema sp. L-07]CRK57516.1 sensor histidine kinase [Alloactinosynnema sp. L-07]